jgi:hypothetical protein
MFRCCYAHARGANLHGRMRIAILIVMGASCGMPQTPPEPAPIPPAVQRRVFEREGRHELTDFGFSTTVVLPAKAQVNWLEGSPDEPRHQTATIRVIHDLDEDNVLFRDRGLRVFLRAPDLSRPTSGGSAWLRRPRAAASRVRCRRLRLDITPPRMNRAGSSCGRSRRRDVHRQGVARRSEAVASTHQPAARPSRARCVGRLQPPW